METQTDIRPDGTIFTLEGSTITMVNNPTLPNNSWTWGTVQGAGEAWVALLLH